MQLLFVGDVMLGRLVNEALTKVPAAYPWGDTLPLFRQADVRICNLECVIADRGERWSITPKMFCFRSDAKNIATLQAAQIDAVSLANNHTLDFGYEALLDMLNILRAAGIHYAGAGRNNREASVPALWQAQGVMLGLIALTDNEPCWEATGERAGILSMPITLDGQRTKTLLETIRTTRAQVDLLLVAAHWGPNWGLAPPPEHIPFAHALIDAGADLIVGHSGHIMRGIEIYKHKPILYCTGNFIDDYAVDPIERNDLSAIFIVETDGPTMLRLLLYPTIIKNFQAKRAQGQERTQVVATMQRQCSMLQTPTLWNEQEERLEIALI